MEKISALIDKLQELKSSNADLQAISYYAQLLQAEILHARTLQRTQEQQAERQPQRHIAVIMPSQPAQAATAAAVTAPAYHNGYTNSHHEDIATVAPAPERQQPPIAPAPEPIPEPVLPPQPVAATPPPAPPVTESAAAAPRPVQEKPAAAATLFDIEQAPAAAKTKETNSLRKEINELVAQHTPSLNDRLKQSKSEIGDRLGEMPVKDLKQAIGINDKFQFIQELFRGDVDMYERSIKTINEFRSLQEAEYWIERELKIRQGWLDDTRVVQHFYTLVKKRFS
ncbi:hypothetical protein [Chitinophaga japonensis]|uniref:Uncharacterized protein n=1 Tax=Chitinophaga japonensis TaxID=104662 RepID=A0A562T3A6_CHIJA|nr:hypothetical protein [Chitinophaga japonensis]TWI88012.1 hypothetical protein LX66_2086 [Chitinophaga japonensis]